MLNIKGKNRISIHALREEGDPFPFQSLKVAVIFLSTPSARRATHLQDVVTEMEIISIHALREEGDRRVARTGGRQKKFLSTPSARRATRPPLR